MRQIKYMALPLAISLLCTQTWAAAPVTQLGKPEGQLNIIAWPGYIERGDSDKKSTTGLPALRKKHRLQGQRQNRRHFG